jgi:hypothetical protein
MFDNDPFLECPAAADHTLENEDCICIGIFLEEIDDWDDFDDVDYGVNDWDFSYDG